MFEVIRVTKRKPRQFALRTERHDDRASQLQPGCQAAGFPIRHPINLKLPFTVEREPVRTEGVGPGVFRAWHSGPRIIKWPAQYAY
jgi:hypothetical protein